jgi:hypothetical protein
MADPTLQDILAKLESLQVEVATMRRRKRRTRRLLPALIVAVLVALVPLSALATNPFTDLNAGSVHNTNIDLIYNAGITTGCVPDAQYCPNDFVTREQMASFLARTAGLGGNSPVANAKTAQTATDATTVGGLAPNGLVRVARAAAHRVDAMPPESSLVVTGGFEDVVSVTLNAPASGFVLVNATVVLRSTHPDPALFRLRDPITSEASTLMQVLTPGNSVALTYVFPVGAGSRAFALQASVTGTPSTIELVDATATALFVPFGSTGGSTLDRP